MPQIVPLRSLPQCCPNTSSAHLLIVNGDAYVSYEAVDGRGPIAMIRFRDCRYAIAGGPNDEALHHHRFSSSGLKHYELQEVIDSPWLPEISALIDKDGERNRLAHHRHFILTLKENTVETIASTVELVGTFDSHHAALTAALPH